ncbi:uncharacterized protein LOC127788930 [Diospyros lotus]|uniref:uncharacterized protein LOC127788930 n=1 Tax=Diospyros lotus TaxID=55363 RepID=UPI0022584157|nr:uncharacterized protein LOC127788930 [Diospyros lotus]
MVFTFNCRVRRFQTPMEEKQLLALLLMAMVSSCFFSSMTAIRTSNEIHRSKPKSEEMAVGGGGDRRVSGVKTEKEGVTTQSDNDEAEVMDYGPPGSNPGHDPKIPPTADACRG